MGSGERFVKSALFGVLLILVGFLLVGSLEGGDEAKRSDTIPIMPRRRLSSSSSTSAERLKGVKVIGIDKLHVHPKSSDLNYMSKRRVPNGPDPIHNRRAGNSGKPPGQA